MKIGFKYKVQGYNPVTKKVLWEWEEENLVPDYARSSLLAAMFLSGTQYPSFYIGAYANDRAPEYDDVSADLPEYGEIESFSEGARQLWTPAAESGGTLESSATPAIFTATVDIPAVRGVFLSTISVFGSTSGLLTSAVQSASPKSLDAGEQLRIPCSFTMST